MFCLLLVLQRCAKPSTRCHTESRTKSPPSATTFILPSQNPLILGSLESSLRNESNEPNFTQIGRVVAMPWTQFLASTYKKLPSPHPGFSTVQGKVGHIIKCF